MPPSWSAPDGRRGQTGSSGLRLGGALALVLVLVGLVAVSCSWLTAAVPEPLSSPSTTPQPSARLGVVSQPVRVRVPSLGIDLPVMSSARRNAWAPRGYPACDVALTWRRFDLPGEPGTTWVLAHAQEGMFLPLLIMSNATDGQGLLRRRIELQLRDGRLLTYRIFRVRQRAASSDMRIARQARGPREQRLILQTSTGPAGTDAKLQVAARLVAATRTDERPPRPRPRPCSQPRRPD